MSQKNLVRGKNLSGRTKFGDQKWSGRTYCDAKICPVNPKLVNTMNTWRLILFSVKMADSSEEGDAKSGDLVEDTYEYLVRNVYPGCKRSTQAMHKKKLRNLL